jgi:ATP-dependent Lhr-like helicase
MGEVVWVGRGSLGSSDGRVALYPRAAAAALLPRQVAAVEGELQALVHEHLSRRGASFYADLLAVAGAAAGDRLFEALWEMVWAGIVTNDTFAPLRQLGPRRPRRPGRPLMRLVPPGAEGRWSLVEQLAVQPPTDTERLHAQSVALLDRYGVLTRQAVLAEGVAGGFAALYPVLRTMEEGGKLRRGYFVDGLGGSQFAVPGAVDRLRAARDPDGAIVALSAADPGNPYGVALPWPVLAGGGRLSRTAGAYVVLDSGELRLYLERGGHALLTNGAVGVEHGQALADVAAALGKIEIRTVDGEPIAGAAIEPMMREAGFTVSPRGLRLWPSARA